jgi:hypothetical protein
MKSKPLLTPFNFALLALTLLGFLSGSGLPPLFVAASAEATANELTIHADNPGPTINRNIMATSPNTSAAHLRGTVGGRGEPHPERPRDSPGRRRRAQTDENSRAPVARRLFCG